MTSDVVRARKAMNISEWPTDRPARTIGILNAICAGVSSGRMPLPKYGMIHPEARLSEEDRKAICEWTSTEIRRQVGLRKKQLISQAN